MESVWAALAGFFSQGAAHPPTPPGTPPALAPATPARAPARARAPAPAPAPAAPALRPAPAPAATPAPVPAAISAAALAPADAAGDGQVLPAAAGFVRAGAAPSPAPALAPGGGQRQLKQLTTGLPGPHRGAPTPVRGLVFMPKAVRTAGEVPLFGEGVPLALGDQPAAAPLAASAPYVHTLGPGPANPDSIDFGSPSPEPDPLPEKPGKSTSNTQPRKSTSTLEYSCFLCRFASVDPGFLANSLVFFQFPLFSPVSPAFFSVF